MINPLPHERPVDELDWLAYCFIAGEMSDQQQAAFEVQLADDQAAREAVARAVELCQAAAVVYAKEVVRPTPARIPASTAWPRSFAWISVGASAALVLAIAWIQFDRMSSWFHTPPASRDDLAEVWSRTRDSVREVVQSEPVEAQPLLESDFSGDLTLPSWITTAVFTEAAAGGSAVDGPSTHDET